MESVLPAFVVVLLLLYATLTPAQSFLSAQDRAQASRQAMEARALERARTDLALMATQISDDGRLVELRVNNTGQTKLADFDRWDMCLQYYDTGGAYHIIWLPYFEGTQPAVNTWSVANILRDAYEPGIFNAGETMVVQFKVSPAVGPETTNQVVLTTSGGIGLSAIFVGPPLPPTATPPAP